MHQSSVLRTSTTPILLLVLRCSQNCFVLLLLTKLPQLKYKLTIKKHNKPDNWVNTSHYRTLMAQLTRGGGEETGKIKEILMIKLLPDTSRRSTGNPNIWKLIPLTSLTINMWALATVRHSWQRSKLTPISVTSGNLNLIVKSSELLGFGRALDVSIKTNILHK